MSVKKETYQEWLYRQPEPPLPKLKKKGGAEYYHFHPRYLEMTQNALQQCFESKLAPNHPCPEEN
jgi:hypothetical protein